jgi:hypothetical protein
MHDAQQDKSQAQYNLPTAAQEFEQYPMKARAGSAAGMLRGKF